MLSGWALGGIALMVGVTLVLIYPRRALIDQLERGGSKDALTLAYLGNLVRTEPDNAALRMLLAEKQFAAGAFDAARTALAPLRGSADAALRRRALRLDYRILEADTFARAPGNFERRAAHEQLVRALHILTAQA